MHVQTLDENGMMLVNQLQWINVMPGERRICTGCHGVREKDADIKHFSVDGGRHGKVQPGGEIRIPVRIPQRPERAIASVGARKEFVNFSTLADTSTAIELTTVQAVLDNRCNSCHGASGAASPGGGLVLEPGGHVPHQSRHHGRV